MSRRRIGQEAFGFAVDRCASSSLDDLIRLIDWGPVDEALSVVSCASKGEPAWPPSALFKAMLLLMWYDLSDVKLAEALDDRASFRRFCGFSRSDPTPERTTFVRFRKALVTHGLDKTLFDDFTRQLKAKAIQVKTGTLVDATIIASASEDDDEGHWVKHKGRPAVHGFKAHIRADADTALVEEIAVTPANINDGKAGPDAYCQRRYPARCRHRYVGSRSSRDTSTPSRLEPTDPTHSWPHREDLRHLETKLLSAPNAMARPG